MHRFHANRVAAGALAFALIGCKGDSNPVVTGTHDATSLDPHFTMGSGTTSTLLGRATFSDPDDQNFKVKRMTGDWHVEIKSKPAFDIAVQSITFQPGGQSGWHTHPGPVFIQVVSGTMTFYKSDDPTCTPIVRTAGQGYLDVGEHPHIARNETAAPAQNVVTYFAPPGAVLRLDEPRPGNCAF
ncbi:MAG TPA: cupin domain-containing protein [Gemmatimonadaceae bacterium]|nr:cupin domain-containing protein [Gemmatimonadaceae bacterium]